MTCNENVVAMSAASLFVTMYWSNTELSRDYLVLVGCGHIQLVTAAAGNDTPAGWWAEAARAYGGSDVAGRVAQRACTVMASTLRSAVAS